MEQIGKFPLSGMEHNSPQSILQFFAGSKNSTDLILYSNGDLQVNSEISEIVGTESLVMANVKNADFIKYTQSKFQNKALHNALAVICFCLSVVYLVNSGYLVDFLFRGLELNLFEQFSIFVVPFVIILLDHYRLKMIQLSQIKLTFSDGEDIVFNGDAPDSALFSMSRIFLFFGLFIIALLTLEWIIEQAPLIGDFFGYLLAAVLVIWLGNGVYNLFFKSESLNPEDSKDFILGYQHMYFAMMMTRNSEVFSGKKPTEVTTAIDEFSKELLQYKDKFGALKTLDEIISASNPSMGVLAIGISTELLMRHCCECIGVKFAPNARNTLDSFIKKYNKERSIESKVKSYLENIKQMRNRAAHDFNIDWDEFKVVAQQFCEVVKWYTNVVETSEIPNLISAD